MRTSSWLSLVAMAVVSASATAQFPNVGITGGVSVGVGAPVPCEGCEEAVITRSVGLLVRERFGIAYRGARWGDQRLASQNRMTSDMITLEARAKTPRRVRPFVTGGLGHSSVRARASDGGHAYYLYGPDASLRTTYWGLGVDMLLFKRLALTPMLSSMSARAADAKGQHCSQPNYTSGDFTYTCSAWTGQRYSLTGLSLGIGIR